MSKQVVIMTYSEDLTLMLQELGKHLTARGARVMRFDTDRFPLEAQVLFGQEPGRELLRFRCHGEDFELGSEDAIWYRRARWAAKLPLTMDKQLRHGCVEESEATLRGAMAAAPCFVLDPPEVVRNSGHKPRQLRIAQQLGMATPRTLITNDPQAAREFIASCPGGVVAKMLSAFPVYNDKGEEQVVFTTALTAEHVEKLDGLRYAPMVFQERIAKALELRITVIGTKIFAAAVDSQSTEGAQTDWRERGVTLLQKWTPYTLPAELEQQLARYMERIGMQYSAIDMIVEPSGRHVFLEANPAGECFWMEYNSPHFPLASALADVLLNEPGARRVVSA